MSKILTLLFAPVFLLIYTNNYAQSNKLSTDLATENKATLNTKVFAIPANPVAKNITFSLGDASNPLNVSSMIVSTPAGSIPVWCDLNGNNCKVVAPILPTNSGKYVWCIKAYDTLSGDYSTNCIYDTLFMLPSIKVNKLTLVKTVTTNPTTIASSIQSISTGSIPKWCAINGTNCSFNAPAVPANPGTYIWSVAAYDTANNLTSAGIILDTLQLLDPQKVVDLNKRLHSVTTNADGSFTVQFNFIVNNQSGQLLNIMSIRDNLTTVFNNNVNFSVQSITHSGYLNANKNYNGTSNLNLLADSIILTNNKQDTVSLKVLVRGNNINGDYYNTAVATVNSHLGIFDVTSNDPIANPTNTNTRLATKFTIPEVNVVVSGGFSPNNDGIDDTWIIKRPYGAQVAVKVFNRWGNEVYSNANYQNDWRGIGVNNFLGRNIPEGTYFYLVEATDQDGTLLKLNGSLTVVR